jgi:hypothetical protein
MSLDLDVNIWQGTTWFLSVVKLSVVMLNVIALAYPVSEALIGTRLIYESGFSCKYLAKSTKWLLVLAKDKLSSLIFSLQASIKKFRNIDTCSNI